MLCVLKQPSIRHMLLNRKHKIQQLKHFVTLNCSHGAKSAVKSRDRQRNCCVFAAPVGSGVRAGGPKSRLCEELDAFLAYVIAEERRR